MKNRRIQYFFSLCLLCMGNLLQAQINSKDNYWLQIYHEEEWGYVDSMGDTVIPLGKYLCCYTDTFRAIAVVSIAHVGFVAINKKEQILFRVYAFDNYPDIPSDSLFRIRSMKSDKIGYANILGDIIIKPKYKYASSFANGCAMVSKNCHLRYDGEYGICDGGRFFYINKKGKKLKNYNTDPKT